MLCKPDFFIEIMRGVMLHCHTRGVKQIRQFQLCLAILDVTNYPYTFLSNVQDILRVPPQYLGMLQLGCVNTAGPSTGGKSQHVRNVGPIVS